MKKGGWDAMRHHEIIAAGCMPYFAEIESCPEQTLFNFRRPYFEQARHLHDTWPQYKASYYTILANMQLNCLMTTESIARRVLDLLQ
jgi:hypothetical protein